MFQEIATKHCSNLFAITRFVPRSIAQIFTQKSVSWYLKLTIHKFLKCLMSRKVFHIKSVVVVFIHCISSPVCPIYLLLKQTTTTNTTTTNNNQPQQRTTRHTVSCSQISTNVPVILAQTEERAVTRLMDTFVAVGLGTREFDAKQVWTVFT